MDRTEKAAATARGGQRGITLLEIMIVLAIIGLVMGVLVGPKVYDSFKEARVKTTFMMLKEYQSAYHRWASDNDGAECPDRLEDLAKYVNKKDTKDPWGSAFVMKCGESAPNEDHFGVISVGADKKEGTEDDIKSWDSKPPKT